MCEHKGDSVDSVEMVADRSGNEEELGRLAKTRATLARSRFARATSGPWRVGMWLLGLLTAGSLGSTALLLATDRGSALVVLALVVIALFGVTALGLIATFYPGPAEELDRAVDGASIELERQVAGVKSRLDLATSKGNRGRGPYASGGPALDKAEIEATRDEVEASLEELQRASRTQRD